MLYGRKAPQPQSTLQFAVMEMFCGGAATLAVALITGETFRADWAAGTVHSWLAFLHLIVFGSWIGFSAFVIITKVDELLPHRWVESHPEARLPPAK